MRRELAHAYSLVNSEPDEAMRIANRLLDDNAKDTDALFCVGRALIVAERFGLAANIFARCIELHPQWEPMMNYALCLISIREFIESERVLHKVLKMNPECAGAYNNLAMIKIASGEPEKAIEYAKKSLELSPGQPEALETIGYAYLMTGDFKRGWEGYEAMLDDSKYRKIKPLRNEPYWQGEKGNLLYLKGEQGLGDEISFASILPDALQDNGIIFDCDPKLEGLFRRSFPQAEVHGTRRDPHKPWLGNRGVDYGALLGSLGHRYRNSAEAFPGTPYLVADSERRVQWRALLDTLPGKKIGLAWTGGLKNTFAHRRSLTLEALAPILTLPDVSWVSLQYQDPTREIAEFQKKHGIRVHHWKRAAESSDYDDQAALVSELDCVVSVQTAIVHLCGGLGKKAFVLVPSKPRWFYGREGKSIPWYNSIEIFRQTKDWPMELVRNAVQKFCRPQLQEAA